MGTNYYLRERKAPEPCPTCGVAREPVDLHIGKSSAGWTFALHVYPEGGDVLPGLAAPESWFDWQVLMKHPDFAIFDEYGDRVTYDVMVAKVTERGASPDRFGKYDTAELRRFMADNSAVPGPSGLWRRKIDLDRVFRHCIGHGEGTWDLCVGGLLVTGSTDQQVLDALSEEWARVVDDPELPSEARRVMYSTRPAIDALLEPTKTLVAQFGVDLEAAVYLALTYYAIGISHGWLAENYTAEEIEQVVAKVRVDHD